MPLVSPSKLLAVPGPPTSSVRNSFQGPESTWRSYHTVTKSARESHSVQRGWEAICSGQYHTTGQYPRHFEIGLGSSFPVV
ncbi:hypothetical protein PF002_g3884 [Phytophthora fragariae]|uniref:Uncharacterized protein n=1 Tax=Phytophthora fragariae TaxID=53985 RepID=A0A6A3M3C4_9STRA|nr:hypothetical protein PF009_g3702 [Phytophthora fragariae]KAE9026116.1 hypothetical protein PF011_g2727 [Phytophthora fragariae]KAE9153063.1 hypothetical protein PF006_g2785 [Phytophthora fragariae]KAE9252321.1 hypothetical protein PF002_g3884 [Phytophthora fragariae]KAE9325383.1 hypothetical protein PF001_g2975 [Phytophthora fragariae]